MPALSLVFPYYENPRMLVRHLAIFRKEWSPQLRREVEVVIVDDGSPRNPAAAVLAEMWNGDRTGLPAISLYRVKEDRPWHQHGARNLGAHGAAAPWLLMTDIDHVVPASTLVEVLRLLPELGRHDVLTFGRVDAPATLTWRADHWPEFKRTTREDGSLKPHVNSFVVNRRRYWRLGGYDESYCGIYGCDQEFRTRLFAGRTVAHHLDHAPLIRVGRDVIADASTRGLDRKTAGRSEAKKKVALRKLLEGRPREILSLDFPWQQVPL